MHGTEEELEALVVQVPNEFGRNRLLESLVAAAEERGRGSLGAIALNAEVSHELGTVLLETSLAPHAAQHGK